MNEKKKSKDLKTNNRNVNTHQEGESVFEGKNVDNLLKLTQDIRLQFKRAHFKKQNRRGSGKEFLI